MTGTRLVALGDVCSMDRRSIAPDDPLAGELPYVGVEHVESMTGTITSLDEGSRVGDGKSNTFRFDQRHVLYGKLRPYLNKVALPGFEGRSSTELVPLLPKPSMDRAYLAYLLRRPQTVDHVMSSVTGARMPRTDMNVLLSMPIPLPPIEEQRRIVDVLNRAASIERLRRQASAHLRDFIPALFLKMFGDPIENPMGWPTSVLGDLVGGFEGGKNIEAGRGNSPYRILKVSAVTSGSFVADESKPAPDNYDPPSHHFVREGDILFSRANTAELVGATAVVDMAPTGLLLPDKLWRVVPKRNSAVIPLFLLQFLKDRSTRSALSRLATGTSSSMQNISQGKLKTLRVITPPLDLQLRFSKLAEAAQARAHLADSANTLAAGLSRSLLDKMLGTDRS